MIHTHPSQAAVHNTCVIHAAGLDFSSSNTEHYKYTMRSHYEYTHTFTRSRANLVGRP